MGTQLTTNGKFKYPGASKRGPSDGGSSPQRSDKSDSSDMMPGSQSPQGAKHEAKGKLVAHAKETHPHTQGKDGQHIPAPGESRPPLAGSAETPGSRGTTAEEQKKDRRGANSFYPVKRGLRGEIIKANT